VLANRIAPGLIDRYLAKSGYSGQLALAEKPEDAPNNLFAPVPGVFGAHGRFDSRHPRTGSWEMFTSRHRTAFWATVAIGMVGGAHLLAKRLKI
jgi:hypothetical protein